MHKLEIESDDAIIIDQKLGETKLGDYAPKKHIVVSEINSIGITVCPGSEFQSNMTIYPLRLEDGGLRAPIDPEPVFSRCLLVA
jgi:hypothetical protein